MNEAYVIFETAKLLKEKGFNIPPDTSYEDCLWQMYDENGKVHWGIYSCDWYFRITQQMAIRWLWEEKGLNINAIYGDYPSLKKSYWMPQIDSLDGCYGVDDENFYREYDSREDCIEAALKYALKNLI